jgi:hypothetical protein
MYILFVLLLDRMTIDEVWTGKVATTRRDYGDTDLHTSQITIRHTRFSQPVTVFTSLLVMVSNGRDFT